MIHTDTSAPWSTMLWQAKSGSMATWQNMYTPSQYDIEAKDIDKDSYRSVITGNLNRSIVGKKWHKIQMVYNLLTADQVNTIVSVINGNNLQIKCKAPAFGNVGNNPITGSTDKWITFYCYVSKYSCKLLEGQLGYELSFNLIQSKRGSWT